MNTKKRGFTLIELIIVLAIIGVMAAIIIPAIVKHSKKQKESNSSSYSDTYTDIDSDSNTTDNNTEIANPELRNTLDNGILKLTKNCEYYAGTINYDSKFLEDFEVYIVESKQWANTYKCFIYECDAKEEILVSAAFQDEEKYGSSFFEYTEDTTTIIAIKDKVFYCIKKVPQISRYRNNTEVENEEKITIVRFSNE